MKRIILFSSLIVVALIGFPQGTPDIPITNLEYAKSLASDKKVPILMVFAGSDWCKPCIQFKRDILSDEAFKSYASENLIVLYLDFPLKKANKLSKEQTEQNELLASKYNPSGAFPKILLLGSNEKFIGDLKFGNQTTAEFIESCKSLIK